MKREDIYKILDTERDFQDQAWDGEEHRTHEVGTFIVYIEHYLNQARTRVSTDINTNGALNELRKVAALAIACFEAHGVPNRK